MKNLNKILSVAAACSLIASCLCGCGKTAPEPQSESNDTAEFVSFSETDSLKNESKVSSESAKESEIPDESELFYITGTASAKIFKSENSAEEPITTVKSGTEVKVKEYDEEKSFSFVVVESENVGGYVENIYLTKEKNSVSSGVKTTVSADEASLYEKNGGKGDVLRNLNLGEEVVILAKTPGGFWRVKTADGEVGYVEANKLVSAVESKKSVDAETNSSERIGTESKENNSEKTGNGTTQYYYYTEENGAPAGDTQTLSPGESAVSSETNSDDRTASSEPLSEFPADNSEGKFDLKAVVDKARNSSGGNWSAALLVIDSGENPYVNDTPMQAASLIKLYIMGAVYDKYETLSAVDPDIDTYLYNMITVSDNASANYLVGLLGSGNKDAGKNVVTEYCRFNGYSNTSMGRLLLESNVNGDNYTSSGDCVKFLSAVYGGTLPHADEMMNLLRQQTRTSKIPSGVPYGIETANKTGELDLVQNDAAVVFAEHPYILCVMSENVGAGSAVSSIVQISSDVYYGLNE